MKKRITAQQREQNPPDEFALRNNASTIGQSEGFEGDQIVDDVVADTGSITISVEMLLTALYKVIESTMLNTRNANNLWLRIKSLVNSGPALSAAHTNLTKILRRLSSKGSFSSTDTQQVKVSVETLLRELFLTGPPPPIAGPTGPYGSSGSSGSSWSSRSYRRWWSSWSSSSYRRWWSSWSSRSYRRWWCTFINLVGALWFILIDSTTNTSTTSTISTTVTTSTRKRRKDGKDVY